MRVNPAGDTILRWIHGDQAEPALRWRNLIRITTSRTGCTLEHGVSRNLRSRQGLPSLAVPRVITELVKTRGQLVTPKELCTGAALQIGDRDARDFLRYVALDKAREAALVLVAPSNQDGGYVVDPAKLASSLLGLAVVAVLSTPKAAYALTGALQKEGYPASFACYDGSVRILEPGLDKSQSAYQHRLWSRLRLVQRPPEVRTQVLAAEIAERLTVRNMPATFETAVEEAEAASRRRVALALLDSTAAFAEATTESLALRAEVRALREELTEALRMQTYFVGEHDAAVRGAAEATERAEQLQRERDDKAAVIDTLQSLLGTAKARRSSDVLSDAERDSLLSLATGKPGPTLTMALHALVALFPSRVVVLESAWKSAERAGGFRHPERAFELLVMLVRDYASALLAGQGDTEARKALGGAYASSESRTGEENIRARQLRTFRYRDREVTMFSHLKIGSKDSVHETWRAHFLWDSDAKLVVIGHCGAHLDLR